MSEEPDQDEIPVAISYSGGASSEWLVRATVYGWLPRPKRLAVFCADTGDEHEWTYERIELVETFCNEEGVPFYRCADPTETLSAHLLAIRPEGRTRADHPPLWIKKHGGGVGRAQHRCTREFKVAPMRRAQAAWLKSIGMPKRIIKWIGFGLDEAARAHKAIANQEKDVQWERLAFPAIPAGLVRGQQREQLQKATGSAPKFSACTHCVFKDPKRWKETPANQLDRVYEVDEAIRDLDEIGLTEGEGFLSSQLIPVRQLIRHGELQPSLPGFEGSCDGGACFL